MAEVVYVMCALTSVFCAVLLFRSYRAGKTRLLMWSTLCFVGLAINNLLLVADKILVPDMDLSLVRAGTGLAPMLLLLIGLIWEES